MKPNRMTSAFLTALLLGPAAAHAGTVATDGPVATQRLASFDNGGIRTVDTTSLAGGSSSQAAISSMPAIPTGFAPAGTLVRQARAEVLRPAPLPDQDFDAPAPGPDALAAQQQASLQPSFYAPAKHFAGDGFSAGSTLDGDHVNRARPGGGMSLSIPMQ